MVLTDTMSVTKQQLLDIEPKNELYFEGPFTDIVTSEIKLSNPLDSPVCFKVKTTVPKRYCVRPSSGVIKPHENLNVAVMLQPFSYVPSEKTKHKFMIQSMILPDEYENRLDTVWKDADPAKIMDSKLVCVLRMPGELVVEPSHELVFDGPFTHSVCSGVTLTNPSTEYICYKLQASSVRLSASPSTGVIPPKGTTQITVMVQPFEYDPNDKPRERLMIKSAVTKNHTDTSYSELLDGANTTDTLLKCVFSVPGLDEKVKPTRHGYAMTAAPEAASPTTKQKMEALMAEIAALRKENAVLKESDIHLRRTALSDTCLTSAEGGGAAIGRTGAIGAIASVPPILYLIFALLIGLVLGKFAL